jgi:hypothetical protein
MTKNDSKEAATKKVRRALNVSMLPIMAIIVIFVNLEN